eukprot:399099_1
MQTPLQTTTCLYYSAPCNSTKNNKLTLRHRMTISRFKGHTKKKESSYKSCPQTLIIIVLIAFVLFIGILITKINQIGEAVESREEVFRYEFMEIYEEIGRIQTYLSKFDNELNKAD